MKRSTSTVRFANGGACDVLREEATNSSIGDGPAAKIYLSQGNLGTGLFAGRDISKGEEILRFTGPLISFAEAVSKGDKECYPLQIDRNSYIDLEPLGCFVNHSCEPNAGIVNDESLVAIRDIRLGEEIRYDYSTTMDEEHFTMGCRCGSKHCRGTVTDFKELPNPVREKYLQMRVVMAFIAKQYAT